MNQAASFGDCNGDTAIHSAAERGRLEANRSEAGRRWRAAVIGCQQVLRIFIDRLPALDFLNNRGETPLHYAALGTSEVASDTPEHSRLS